jgi:hypothetical protein
MSLVQYTISNNSSVGKTFVYYSASVTYNKFVPGFTSSIFLGDNSPLPTLLITGSMVSEDTFVSNAYIPPSGSAWLWNNGNKVQYIKISDTPLTGSNIDTVIKKAEWVEFSMVGAKNKDGNLLYPTSPSSSQIERYIIGNVNDKGTYNSIIINDASSETSTAVFANVEDAETGFSYIDQQFSVNQDCDPLLNNATEPRVNEWLQDVDYSVNAVTPINFNQLINFTATKASVPQSNYTQLGFTNSRYVGSSTTRDNINVYNPTGSSDPINKLVYTDIAKILPLNLINKGKGPSLGKIPNVELNNAHIAYFNRIIDPYPLLNNKVAYYVKYLIDEGGNILDPNVSDINFSIFKDTFQLKDYDYKPTRVNTAISTIEQGKELVKLTDGLHSVHTVGAYPVPILYTQTSSMGNVDSIALSGSEFFTALGFNNGDPVNFLKLGIDIFATQSDATSATDRLTPVSSIDLGKLTWGPNDITPFTSNISPTTYPTSSVYPTSSLLFPLDTESRASPPNTAGGRLSDNYRVEGSFTFTTSTIPCKYKGGRGVGENDLESSIKFYLGREEISNSKILAFTLSPYIKPPASDDLVGNYVNTIEGFNVKTVKLVITEDPGGSNAFSYPPLLIPKSAEGYGTQWDVGENIPSGLLINPFVAPTLVTGFSFTPNSLFIEDLIIQNLISGGNIYNKGNRRAALPLIAGGWASNYGYGSVPIKYDWIIEFEFNNINQKTGLFLECDGDIGFQSDSKTFPGGRPFDVFLFFGQNGVRRSDLQWKRTFNPTYTTAIPTKPILEYTVTSPLSENVVRNTADGPFWRRYPISGNPANALTTDELYMSSSILNQIYSKSFYQAKLPYTGSVNVNFPLTVEPSFIEFDPVIDFWKIEKGDEIRFENNENLTFKVVDITFDPSEAKDRNESDISQKLRVRVSPPFDGSKQPFNFDFFVVRRYKSNKNFIILDQQMPYGIISTGKGEIAFSGEDGFVGVQPVSPSSSPGLLLPQHRVSKFNTNPDLILKDLIEKRII